MMPVTVVPVTRSDPHYNAYDEAPNFQIDLVDESMDALSQRECRRVSVDSGTGPDLSQSSQDFNHVSGLEIRKVQSVLSRPRVQSNLVYEQRSVSEQTLLLLQKLDILEQKLMSVQTELQTERSHRLALENKVAKLEEDNNSLKSNKEKATLQLQDFADKFFSMPEPFAKPSPSSSPCPSLVELRRTRSGSLFSSSSSGRSDARLSRVSGLSLPF